MEKEDYVISEILVAAKSLFAQFGLKKTTIEDISLASGKGKSTLYNYFPGKNEIFEAVVKYEMQSVIRRLLETVDSSLSAKNKLKTFLTVQSTAMVELHSLYKVLFEDMIESRKMLMPLRLKYEETQIDMITRIILTGTASGEFKQLAVAHIRKIALVIIIAFRGLHFPLSINPAEMRPADYFDALIDMLVEGIGN